MPSVQFTFKLPEESDEARTAMDAMKWRGLVWDVKQELRNKLKHGDMNDAEQAAYEKIADMINSEMNEQGLFFE